MSRKTKRPYIYSTLFLLALIATSLLSVKGWCVDKSGESVVAHIKLVDCHSIFPVEKDIALFAAETAHAADSKHCTSCHDLTPDVRGVRIFDDSLGVPLSAPSYNAIFPSHYHSDLPAFATLPPGDVLAIYQRSSDQTQQTKTIRIVVLLI